MQRQSTPTIRVLIADDHPVVRNGIRDELAKHPDLELVGEATTGDEALELCSSLEADVLVLDINMPGLSAVEATHGLMAQERPPRILVLSAYGDLESAQAMLTAGVQGYMLKDEDPARIPEGIRAVYNGIRWLSAEIGNVVADPPAPFDITSLLSPREVQVLKIMAHGKDNIRIASRLSITEGTVKNHVSNIYTKLGVNSRAEAVSYAWRHGLADGYSAGAGDADDPLD